MINKLDDMLKKLKGDKRVNLSVAAAHDEEVLLAIKSAVEMEIITPILIGEENKIREISKEINFDLSKFKIINKEQVASIYKKPNYEELHNPYNEVTHSISSKHEVNT